MNNTVLKLLQIFENETDNEHALTKVELLQRLQDDGFTIEEKQFYRKVQELKDNGYNIEIQKGRQTKYFLRKFRLSKEEWIFLLTLILGSKDLSIRETKHIIECLESMSICYNSIDYAEEYKNKIVVEKSKYNQLKNFHVILNALDEDRVVECKTVRQINGEWDISELKTLKPVGFISKDNRIIINVIEEGEKTDYFLSELIDVEII